MTKSYRVYRIYLLFRAKISILVDHIKSKIKIPFKERIKYLFKGFKSESYYIYDLPNNDYSKYLSDYEREKSSFINEESYSIVNNKIVFDKMIRENIEGPEIYSIILKGKFYQYSEELVIVNTTDLVEHIKKEGKLVLKPYVASGGGSGVCIYEYKDENVYLNGKITNKEDIGQIVNKLDKYIITEHVKQHEYSSKIYPHSVNTIRIVTMEDPYTQEIFIPIAVHRFGTRRSNNVDNWDKGGMSAQIDIETGILSKATSKPIENKVTWYTNHPDTGTKIEGTKVPYWDLIKEKVVLASERLPFLKYIGWDVLITKDGKISIIEANNCTSVSLLQVHRPLLIDKRVEKFYKYHKII